MKKIIGAALATTMLAGSAFAADISFSYTGANYFTSNGGNFNLLQGHTDSLSVQLSNEKAGVVVDFDTDFSSATPLSQDNYYGWMTFALPVGNLQITAGKFGGRYVNTVTTDSGDLDGEDWIKWDMGIINPNGSVGADSDNLTKNPAGDRVLSTVLAYTLADSLPGALLVKAGLVSVGEWDTWKARSSSNWSWNSGFVAEVAYRQEKVINLNAAFKSYQKTDASFGFFVSPLMIDNLEATLGLTLATERPDTNVFTAKKSALYDRTYDFALDLRARYQVSDAFSVTTAHNLTIYNYYNIAATTEDAKDEETRKGMWNQLGFAYKFAEKLTAKFSYQQYSSQIFEYHKGATNNCFFDKVFFTPSLEIAATEKATVTVASRFEWNDIGHESHEAFGVTVPVIFSYNY